jgi:asparagine synthase (glutamine-hydrolysing)
MDRELRPLVDDLLSPRSLRSRGLFDPVAVQRLVDLDRARRVDGAYNVFGVMCVELWCRIFLDGDGAPP